MSSVENFGNLICFFKFIFGFDGLLCYSRYYVLIGIVSFFCRIIRDGLCFIVVFFVEIDVIVVVGFYEVCRDL